MLIVDLANHAANDGEITIAREQLLNNAWLLNGITSIENRAGLPKVSVDQTIQLNSGAALQLSSNQVMYVDHQTGQQYPTNIQGVSSLTLDAKGEKAYALINQQVISINIGDSTKQFNISQNFNNPLSVKDTTSISVSTHPGSDIEAFAVANKTLLVQLKTDGSIEAVHHGEIKSLEGITHLPNNEAIKQLAFDDAGHLLALSDDGNLFRLEEKYLKSQLKTNDTTESTQKNAGWTEVKRQVSLADSSSKASMSITDKIDSIHSGHNIKITFKTPDGVIPKPMMMTAAGFELEPFRSEVKTNAFADFHNRTDYGHMHESDKLRRFADKMLGKSDEQQVAPEFSYGHRQAVKTRFGNWLAHDLDPIRRAPEFVNQHIVRRINGTEATREVSSAAELIRDDYNDEIKGIRSEKISRTLTDVQLLTWQ